MSSPKPPTKSVRAKANDYITAENSITRLRFVLVSIGYGDDANTNTNRNRVNSFSGSWWSPRRTARTFPHRRL